ncbi:MAG: hypothetical protein GY835_24155 [bacterium]|nr:hypothetical protein [bacterium]
MPDCDQIGWCLEDCTCSSSCNQQCCEDPYTVSTCDQTGEPCVGSPLCPSCSCSGGSIYGTDANDVMYGNANDNCIYGLAGDDTLYGGAGYDCLYGGPGIDTCIGGEENYGCENVR